MWADCGGGVGGGGREGGAGRRGSGEKLEGMGRAKHAPRFSPPARPARLGPGPFFFLPGVHGPWGGPGLHRGGLLTWRVVGEGRERRVQKKRGTPGKEKRGRSDGRVIVVGAAAPQPALPSLPCPHRTFLFSTLCRQHGNSTPPPPPRSHAHKHTHPEEGKTPRCPATTPQNLRRRLTHPGTVRPSPRGTLRAIPPSALSPRPTLSPALTPGRSLSLSHTHTHTPPQMNTHT